MNENINEIKKLLLQIHHENMGIINKLFGFEIANKYDESFMKEFSGKSYSTKEILAVREELLKRGDLYYGFKSSILSAIRENFDKVTANGIEVMATMKDESEIAEKILDRIIGEE